MAVRFLADVWSLLVWVLVAVAIGGLVLLAAAALAIELASG